MACKKFNNGLVDHVDKQLKELMGNDDEKELYNMGKVLMKTLKKYSEKINQIEVNSGDSETNGSILRRSIQLAKWMKSCGITEGDVIMLSAANHLDAVIVIVAALFLGATLFPVDHSLKCDDLKHMIVLTEPKLIFCDSDNILTVMEKELSIICDFQIIVFGKQYDGDITKFDEIFAHQYGSIKEFRPNDFDPETTAAFIQSTSGSTGTPKGVVLTHKCYLIRLFDWWSPGIESYEDSIFMVNSPLSWATGCSIAMTSCIFGSKKVMSNTKCNEDIAFKIINNYKPTIGLFGPSFLKSLLDHEKCRDADWSSFRKIFLAGSVFGLDLANKMQQKLINCVLVSVYGMTETNGAISSIVLERPPKNIPLGYVRTILKAKVVNPQGREVESGESGELLLKSKYMFKEYYKNPAATKECHTSDGWFKTGDIVYRNDDNVIFYVDRLKLMMKYENYQISPVELETVISSHPGVDSVVVDKIEIPPNDLPFAFIVKKREAILTEEEIKDLVANKLASHKQLRGGVIFLDSMPVTTAGKINRKELNQIKLKFVKEKFGKPCT